MEICEKNSSRTFEPSSGRPGIIVERKTRLDEEQPKVGCTDEQLMLDLKSGDRRAFNVLVGRYRDRMVSYAYRMVGNAELAQDMAQETFVRVFRGAHTFREGSRFSPWLYKIATNVCISERSKRDRDVVSVDSDGLESTQDAGIAVEDQVLKSITVEQLCTRMAQLTPEHKNVLVMHINQGLTYVEIGEALGIPTGTVKSRLFYAIRKLREVCGLEVS